MMLKFVVLSVFLVLGARDVATSPTTSFLPLNKPVVLNGQCDSDILAVSNFDVSKFLGRWHVIESYPTSSKDGASNDVSYLRSGDLIQVTYRRVEEDAIQTVTGEGFEQDNGKLTITFPDSQTAVNYWILDTDYTSYGLVYSCENINARYKRVYSWKLSRSNELSVSAAKSISNRLKEIEVLDQGFQNVLDRSGKTDDLVPQPGVPMVFPGQCNTTTSRFTTNFDIPAYIGLWHHIETYPFPAYPPGSICGGRLYTQGERDDLVDIIFYRTQDNTLNIGAGQATQINTNGFFSVVFQSDSGDAAAPSDVTVLATDYESYALTYSCQNIDANHKVVVAFKLSRTRTMPAAGTAVIDSILGQWPELDQRYFLPVEQRDDCQMPN